MSTGSKRCPICTRDIICHPPFLNEWNCCLCNLTGGLQQSTYNCGNSECNFGICNICYTSKTCPSQGCLLYLIDLKQFVADDENCWTCDCCNTVYNRNTLSRGCLEHNITYCPNCWRK